MLLVLVIEVIHSLEYMYTVQSCRSTYGKASWIIELEAALVLSYVVK